MYIQRYWFVWVVILLLIVTGCGGRKTTKTSHVAPRGMDYSPPLPYLPTIIHVQVRGFYKDSLPFKNLPMLVDTPQIGYPAIAKQAWIEGTVRLVVSVDSSGEVTKAVVARSSGNQALDEASVGVSKSKFSTPVLKKKKKRRAPFPLCELIVDVAFQFEKEKK
jgi:TonB family protein